jgi:arginine/ornithine N-succinyltransferase beta subunit
MNKEQRGIRKSSALITVAAAATPQTLYQRTTGGHQARTVILRKIMAYNAVGATTLSIGTGLAAAWAAAFPVFRLVNATDNVWVEEEIPEVELSGDLTVQTDVLGVTIVCEVEEVGS